MGKPDAEGHGPADGLPGLPPEWGRIVIPDDASALADEAAQLRRELRRAAGDRAGHLALPVLVLMVALLTTMVGLIAVAWPRASRSTDRPAPTPYAPPATVAGRGLPALDLVDAAQAPVPLRGLLPAMIILVDGCPCPERVAEAVAAAPPGIAVLTVSGGRAVAAPPPTSGGVRALADPAGGLRSFLGEPARAGTLTALLVDRAGTVTRVLPDLGPVDSYRNDLVALAG